MTGNPRIGPCPYSDVANTCFWPTCGCPDLAPSDSVGTPDSSNDPVNHPPHYTKHPSGIECIAITRHMIFNLGNAVKYIWRADLKGDAIEDLKKARWYLDDEIAKRELACKS